MAPRLRGIRGTDDVCAAVCPLQPLVGPRFAEQPAEDHPRGCSASEFSALLSQHVLLPAGFFELQVEALDGEGQREIRHLLLFRFEPRDAELLEATTVELD